VYIFVAREVVDVLRETVCKTRRRRGGSLAMKRKTENNRRLCKQYLKKWLLRVYRALLLFNNLLDLLFCMR